MLFALPLLALSKIKIIINNNSNNETATKKPDTTEHERVGRAH